MGIGFTRIGSRTAAGVAALAVVGAGVVAAAPAATAAQGLQPLTCDGQDLVVRVPNNNSSDRGGWNAAQVVEGGSGTLIPTSFDISAYDVTQDQEIFSAVQTGAGRAHGNQATVTCTQVTTASLGDLLEPGDEVPPGASLDDEVSFSLTVTAVWQR